MNTNQNDQIVEQLDLIRRSIDRTQNLGRGGLSSRSIGTLIALHLIAIAFCALFGIFEVANDGAITQDVLVSTANPQLRLPGMLSIGFFLLLVTFGFYFFLWRGAKKNNESVGNFAATHFTYLHRMAGCSDLFVKYVAVTLVVLAGKAEWFAPLLLLFTGDYLLQGRFFVISQRYSFILGVFCTLGAIVQLISGNPSLAYPLFTFLGLSLVSLTRALRVRSNLLTEKE